MKAHRLGIILLQIAKVEYFSIQGTSAQTIQVRNDEKKS